MNAVSIVVPLYNKKDAVRQTIDSALRQELSEFEVIVVDDGSTDGSVEALADISDERLRIIRQQNRGLSEARNRGIAASRADLIALLDADDLWDADHLSTLLGLAATFPSAGLLGTRYRILRQSGEVLEPAYAYDALPRGDGVVSEYFRAATLGAAPFLPSCVLIRKAALEAVGPFRGRYGEDSDMWMRMALRGPVALSAQTTMSYRLYVDDPTSTGRKKRAREDLSSPHFSAWPVLTGHGDPWLDEYVALKQIQQLTYYALAGLGSTVRRRLRHVTTRKFTWEKRRLWLKTWLPPRAIVAVSRWKLAVRGSLGLR